jgi:DNA-binding MarR family transcriptional regulator
VVRRSLEETVGYRIALASRAHRNVTARVLAQFGLYLGQELILAELWQEDGLTQTCLAGRVGIDLSTATKALQRLERYGLIERQTDPDDIRAQRVRLTAQGRALQTPVTAAWYDLEERALRGLSCDERATLADLLRRIEANLG